MTSPMPKPFHCSDCGKEFSKEKKLISHFKVHSTDKSYKCEVCKITLSQRALYKKHIKTHFEKGKYPCPKCGKVFIRHSWLKKHMNSQCDEITLNEIKYICKDCGRPYDSLTGARSHLLKGKHMQPVFTCHACMWICTSSKALFVHVLQHNNADITVIGLTQEKRFEHYSTAKIRSKVNIYKKSQAASAVEKTNKGATKAPEIIKVDEDDDILQTESTQPSQNIIMPTTEINIMPATDITAQSNVTTTTREDNILQNEDLGQHASAEIVEERLNDIKLSEEKNAQTTILKEKMQNFPPMPQNNCMELIFQSGRQDLDKTAEQCKIALREENTACGSISASEKTIQSEDRIPRKSEDRIPKKSEDRIPRKMPKLVSLYPEEETIMHDIPCTIANNNLLMQNEMPLPHGMLQNRFSPPVTTTIMQQHNEAVPVMPYAAPPLVNTMFLPPLFLVQNNLPVNPVNPINQGIRQPNPFQMGETILENQPMIDKTADIRRAHDFRTMAGAAAMMLPRKKKKRQTRAGKKFPDQIKQQDVSSEKRSIQNSKTNKNTLPTHDITSTKDDGQTTIHKSSTSIFDQSAGVKLDDVPTHHQGGTQDHKNTIIVQEEENPIEKTINNWFMNEDINQYNSEEAEKRKQSDNHFWATLMAGDDSSNKRKINSFSDGNTNQLNLRDKIQNSSSHLSEFCDDTITTTLDRPGENIPKKISDNATVKHQQNGPIGGIDVEDYIKKFMWF